MALQWQPSGATGAWSNSWEDRVRGSGLTRGKLICAFAVRCPVFPPWLPWRASQTGTPGARCGVTGKLGERIPSGLPGRRSSDQRHHHERDTGQQHSTRQQNEYRTERKPSCRTATDHGGTGVRGVVRDLGPLGTPVRALTLTPYAVTVDIRVVMLVATLVPVGPLQLSLHGDPGHYSRGDSRAPLGGGAPPARRRSGGCARRMAGVPNTLDAAYPGDQSRRTRFGAARSSGFSVTDFALSGRGSSASRTGSARRTACANSCTAWALRHRGGMPRARRPSIRRSAVGCPSIRRSAVGPWRRERRPGLSPPPVSGAARRPPPGPLCRGHAGTLGEPGIREDGSVGMHLLLLNPPGRPAGGHR